MNKGKKVLVAMSGGVDSSVTALLLKQKGYDITGVTMRLGLKASSDEARFGEQAVNDAKEICKKLDMPHFVLDFSDMLNNKVIDSFVNEYSNGRTPNPCVNCNKHLKFGSLLKQALDRGFDFLATGHYANIVKEESVYMLKKAKDLSKDQTYFLYGIEKNKLPFIMFPLGKYLKTEVKEIARENGLEVANRKESQDICFIPNGDYRELLEQKLKFAKGDIVDTSGKILGEHNGVHNFTIGQRRGTGIALGKPVYVTAINPQKNVVTIGDKEYLYAKSFVADDINLFTDKIPETAKAKIRYLHSAKDCSVKKLKDNELNIIFKEKQKSITPGQSVILYDKDIVLGGGVIKEVLEK